MTSVMIAHDTIVKTPSPSHAKKLKPTYTHTLSGRRKNRIIESIAAIIDDAAQVSALPNLPTSGFAATDEAMPSAYRAPALSLLAAGIYPKDDDGLLSVGGTLDRAAAAEMLYGALLMSK